MNKKYAALKPETEANQSKDCKINKTWKEKRGKIKTLCSTSTSLCPCNGIDCKRMYWFCSPRSSLSFSLSLCHSICCLFAFQFDVSSQFQCEGNENVFISKYQHGRISNQIRFIFHRNALQKLNCAHRHKQFAWIDISKNATQKCRLIKRRWLQYHLVSYEICNAFKPFLALLFKNAKQWQLHNLNVMRSKWIYLYQKLANERISGLSIHR